MTESTHITLGGDASAELILRMANRHGLIAGAAGTGKTVSLQVLAEKIEQVARLIRSKAVGVYFISQNPLDIPVDRESAHERLNQRATERTASVPEAAAVSTKRGREPESIVTSMAKSAARAIGSQRGRR